MTNITRMPWMKEDYTATKRNILVSDEPITSKMPLETPLPSWEEAVRVIQAVVDEKEDEKIKQAWKRILQG
jgi:hypothetical protein